MARRPIDAAQIQAAFSYYKLGDYPHYQDAVHELSDDELRMLREKEIEFDEHQLNRKNSFTGL